MTEVEDDAEFQIAEYCARMSCKKLIAQTPGRGRRREYCSETCRRGADREYKRAKTLVEHFERALRNTRHEVAAYGRRSEDGELLTLDEAARRAAAAQSAISRAHGVLEFTADQVDDRFRQELLLLVDAVASVIDEHPARKTA